MSVQQFDEDKHVSFVVDLLYESRDRSADVYFVYDGPSGNQVVRIPAHRNVLAISSTVLNELFFGPQKISGDIPTRSSTVSSQTFEAFISLLYGTNQRFFFNFIIYYVFEFNHWLIYWILLEFPGKWNSITKDNYLDLFRISQNFNASFAVEACKAFIKKMDEIEPEIDR